MTSIHEIKIKCSVSIYNYNLQPLTITFNYNSLIDAPIRKVCFLWHGIGIHVCLHSLCDLTSSNSCNQLVWHHRGLEMTQNTCRKQIRAHVNNNRWCNETKGGKDRERPQLHTDKTVLPHWPHYQIYKLQQ